MPKYCVHIQERGKEYEDVFADTPEKAVQQIIDRDYAGDYDEIESTEAMITCPECGLDNKNDRKKCDECNTEL